MQFSFSCSPRPSRDGFSGAETPGSKRRLYSAVPGRHYVVVKSYQPQAEGEIVLYKNDRVKGMVPKRLNQWIIYITSLIMVAFCTLGFLLLLESAVLISHFSGLLLWDICAATLVHLLVFSIPAAAAWLQSQLLYLCVYIFMCLDDEFADDADDKMGCWWWCWGSLMFQLMKGLVIAGCAAWGVRAVKTENYLIRRVDPVFRSRARKY